MYGHQYEKYLTPGITAAVCPRGFMFIIGGPGEKPGGGPAGGAP